MRNSTLILFGLLLVLLAISSVDGTSRLRKHHPHNKGKHHHHHVTPRSKRAAKEVQRKADEEGVLHKRSTSIEKYSPYYEGTHVADRLTQQHDTKHPKGFDETKARLAADVAVSKKPQTYLESIGGGHGGSKEVQKKLAQQRKQKGLKYY
ncbi:unnamed protein product [Rodentolepis nana]|uniref:Conserved secreted protein n=1 Tax=Rodentolepis nana TaxID=102285 RepID=A0A0R3T992_RODNA|nr:unnamed protein product [Rodentolepis nana]